MTPAASAVARWTALARLSAAGSAAADPESRDDHYDAATKARVASIVAQLAIG